MSDLSYGHKLDNRRDRSWSRSPIRKERRDRQYSSHRERSGQERREKYDKYQDKYKKGERIERDHYRR